MLRVGLTGGLGSGKSTVAQILRDLGAEVIESDELGRALMEPGQAAFNEIVRVFGPGVLMPDGRLNRARLAEIAFKKKQSRQAGVWCKAKSLRIGVQTQVADRRQASPSVSLPEEL